jgi:hypothetical protein
MLRDEVGKRNYFLCEMTFGQSPEIPSIQQGPLFKLNFAADNG